MDSDMSGPTATITMTSTRVSTVTMPSGSATPTRQQHDNNTSDSSNSKRPPPLQPVNVSVQVQSASVTVSGSDAQYSGVATLGVNTPSTPRIDISRASSSSHHEDSRDSSPDNVFEQVMIGVFCVYNFMFVCFEKRKIVKTNAKRSEPEPYRNLLVWAFVRRVPWIYVALLRNYTLWILSRKRKNRRNCNR